MSAKLDARICKDLDELVESVHLSECWHSHGSLSRRVLSAMASHLKPLDIECSVETGCGKSTMLIAQFSRNHKAFTADGEDILQTARTSEILAGRNVEFVVGPTQRTLPGYTFSEPLQVILLDGPHAYPFPELEYYFLYPHLDAGGLLILDDVDIPTVRNMFSILKSDAMFDYLETVGTTAFLKRTDAPTFDPYGDGWAAQGFNAGKSKSMKRMSKLAKLIPEPILRVSRSWRRI